MLTSPIAALFASTLLCTVAVAAHIKTPNAKRQAPVLPSYEPYINVTRDDRTPVTLHIDTLNISARNATSPDLYGLMHEDINHSGDGGIYAEMIANRAFQGSNSQIGSITGYLGSLIQSSENPIVPFGPVTTAWGTVGQGVRATLDILHPLNALPTSLEIDIPINATGEVGFENYGWWGFDVRPQVYQVSFYVLGNFPRNMGNTTTFTVSFRNNITDEIYASSTISDVAVPFIDFLQINTTLVPEVFAPDINNKFVVTMNGPDVQGHTYYVNLVSVFPETFKGVQNGLRNDIASAFNDIKPRFLRFPGGNNLEGYSPAARWNWRKTIGPLTERPGRVGDWGYVNTNGLGLLEYLEWTEAMNMKPSLAVYAGFSLDIYGQNGASYPPERMGEIVQDALDELEYCMGGLNTTYGALRATHGHPAPFNIPFVEIGNEDFFSSTYPYRFEAMYKGLKAVYPDIQYISTAFNENANYNISIPSGNIYDYHNYNTPSWFLENFNQWDNWQEETGNDNVTVLVGEFSVIQIDTYIGTVNYSFPADVHVSYPRLLSAIAEAVYAIGFERNSNTVKMSSYAPSLQNRNFTQWTPDLIDFSANTNETVLTASYWQQWLFSHFQGDYTLPVTNEGGQINPMYWVASIDEAKNAVYLKIVNTLNDTVPLTVDLPSFCNVNGTILTATDLNSFNYVNNMTEVVPKPIDFGTAATSNSSGGFSWDVPRFSVNVLQFDL